MALLDKLDNRGGEKEKKKLVIFMIRKPKFNDMAVLEYKVGETLFEIYTAKNLYSPGWTSSNLKKKVLEARKSFLRYGKVQIFDDYDKKSAVYLCKATYEDRENKKEGEPSKNIEEWLSIRFIPADQYPPRTPDLEECLFMDKPLSQYLPRSGVFKNSENFLSEIVSISKICGFVKSTLDDNEKKYSIKHMGLRYTPISFILINKHFIDDVYRMKLPFRYITGLFRNELIEKRLTIKISGGLIPRFHPAYKLLGLPPKKIYINRQASAYMFPAYFLNMDQLKSALRELCEKNKISPETVKHYLGKELNLEKVYASKLHEIMAIKNLGNLVTAKGKLHGSSMTGEQLREFLDKRVQDGAELKLMKVESWKEDVQKALDCLIPTKAI